MRYMLKKIKSLIGYLLIIIGIILSIAITIDLVPNEILLNYIKALPQMLLCIFFLFVGLWLSKDDDKK